MFPSFSLPGALFDIRESGLSMLVSETSLNRYSGLQILNHITPALLQSGYRITRLKRYGASVAILRCSKSDLRIGMILSAACEGDMVHCELNLWRMYSRFDRQEVRRKKIEQDVEPLRELYCAIDRQIRTVFEIDAIWWAPGAKGLRIIGSDGRPEMRTIANAELKAFTNVGDVQQLIKETIS